jgi:hypothetical protein
MAPACEGEPPKLKGSVQQLRTGQGDDNDLLVAMDVLVTDAEGRAIPCGQGTMNVGVSVSFQGPDRGFVALPAAQTQMTCAATGAGDFALVSDNSGSEEGYLPHLQTAARLFVDKIVPPGGRASLTRVSTVSSVTQELSGDQTVLHTAVDNLYVKNGWTALFDGIRMGNETLGGARIDAEAAGNGTRFANRAAFCTAARKLGIVVFTDGRENNSAGEMLLSEDNDGIDTRLSDLQDLSVEGITTPIYSVGLGRDVDTQLLSTLAEDTGGRSLMIDDPAQLPNAFDVISDYAQSTFQVCVDMPGGGCGKLWVKAQYTWTDGVNTITGNVVQSKDVPCPVVAASPGRVATILLALNDPGIPHTVAAQLVRQTLGWAAPRPSPRILVVRDDNHHDEDANDSQLVRDMMVASGFSADYLDEPSGGLTDAAIAPYDVIWFSNPGYPMNDQASLNVLIRASSMGKGVVLQGDDMGWSMGKAFSMAPLTRANFTDNGTQACKTTIDNRRGGKYVVAMTAANHPVSAGLDGVTFTYGNDIDLVVPRGEGEAVISATVSVLNAKGKEVCKESRPVVIVYQP